MKTKYKFIIFLTFSILAVFFFIFSSFATTYNGNIEIKLCLNNEIIIALDGQNNDNIAETAFIFQTDNPDYQSENINMIIENGQIDYQEEYLIIKDSSDYFCFVLFESEIVYSSDISINHYYLGFGLSKHYNLTLDLPLPNEDNCYAMFLIESGGGGGTGGSGGSGGGSGGGKSDCKNCTSGGSGSISCSVNDIWSGCSTTCSSGYYACCKGGNNTCKCCKQSDKIGGIIMFEGNNFSLYPVPSDGTIFIDISEIGYQNVTLIKITEIQSSTVVHQVTTGFLDKMNFDLNLNDGYHIISIYTSNTIYGLNLLISNE